MWLKNLGRGASKDARQTFGAGVDQFVRLLDCRCVESTQKSGPGSLPMAQATDIPKNTAPRKFDFSILKIF